MAKDDKTRVANLKVGEIVLVSSENKKRIEWPMGRILEIFPGKDGKIRLVKVKVRDGEMLRPVQRVYPLEVGLDWTEGLSKETETISADNTELAQEQSALPALPKVDQQVVTRGGRLVRAPQKLDLFNQKILF